MKKGILFAMVGVLLMCSTVFAEASFDQIQGLIKAQDYVAAINGLELIIQNHPKSAKAYYAMSQAQAGAGNLVKAREALDKAKGIDPTLKFASSGNVERLSEAITPQTAKVEAIESHGLRNFLILLLLIGGGVGIFVYVRNRKAEEAAEAEIKPEPVTPYHPPTRMTDPVPTSTFADTRAVSSERPIYHSRPAPSAPPPVVHNTTVINNGGGTNDFVAGMVVGEMLSGPHHHHAVEREYVPVYTPAPAAAPAPTRSSWEDDAPAPVREVSSPAPTRSSSWDDDSSSSSGSSSSRSSSWDDSSSSSSSSSWDDSSSSSSSSWD